MECIRGYKYGNFLYLYYRYLDRFHTEPGSVKGLLEGIEYERIEGKKEKLINEYIRSIKES